MLLLPSILEGYDFSSFSRVVEEGSLVRRERERSKERESERAKAKAKAKASEKER
jgi:hypothetical protein